jgi:tetratricopeptide (TPR) repeat protein
MLDKQIYIGHRDFGTSMADADLANLKLTDAFRSRVVKGLTGLKKVGSNQFIGLLFDENSPFIELELLDDLLEHCLTAAFYLRYAVIPLKLAEAYMLQGSYQQAVDHLKLVYDDHPTNEMLREIYPYLTQTINIFTPIAGADEKLMRLRLGDAYLKQADLLFRQNTASSKYKAKKLFKRVLVLHNETDRCECEGRLGEVIESVLKNIFDFQDVVNNTNISRFADLLNLSYQNAEPFDYGSIFNRNLNKEMSKQEFERALETTQEEIAKTRQNYRNQLKSNTSLDRLRGHSQKLLEETEVRTVALKNRSQIDSQYYQFNK